MKKRNCLVKVASFILAAFLLPLTSLMAQNEEWITIKHAKGETKVKKNPKRVVVFDNGSLETFYVLGIPVAGVPTSVPAQIAEFKSEKYTKLGSMPSPSVKDITAFGPDLIVVGGRHQKVYDSLATIAPTLLFSVDSKDYWNSFEHNVRSIASIFGKDPQKQLTEIKRKYEIVKSKTKEDSGKALVTLYVNGKHNPNGAGSRFGFPFDILGLKPAFSGAENAQTEGRNRGGGQAEGYIKELNPDYIFIIDRQEGLSGKGDDWEQKVNNDIRQTKAFSNQKVFSLPGGIWYLSGGGLLSVDKQISDIGQFLYGNIF